MLAADKGTEPGISTYEIAQTIQLFIPNATATAVTRRDSAHPN